MTTTVRWNVMMTGPEVDSVAKDRAWTRARASEPARASTGMMVSAMGPSAVSSAHRSVYSCRGRFGDPGRGAHGARGQQCRSAWAEPDLLAFHVPACVDGGHRLVGRPVQAGVAAGFQLQPASVDGGGGGLAAKAGDGEDEEEHDEQHHAPQEAARLLRYLPQLLVAFLYQHMVGGGGF